MAPLIASQQQSDRVVNPTAATECKEPKSTAHHGLLSEGLVEEHAVGKTFGYVRQSPLIAKDASLSPKVVDCDALRPLTKVVPH